MRNVTAGSAWPSRVAATVPLLPAATRNGEPASPGQVTGAGPALGQTGNGQISLWPPGDCPAWVCQQRGDLLITARRAADRRAIRGQTSRPQNSAEQALCEPRDRNVMLATEVA